MRGQSFMNNMSIKILIIDDSLMMRTLLNNIVSTENYCEIVGLGSNGKEGLELVKYQQPDLIFLDIEMPVMNGIEFLKRVRLISKAKVIVVSYIVKDNFVHKQMLESYGATTVISKPSGSLSLNLDEERGKEIINIIRSLYPNQGGLHDKN